MAKKIFILLPDGIGLRNFAYTNFHKIGIANNFDITFWNATAFNLESLGFKEIKISDPKVHFLTDLLKKAQTNIELNLNIKRAHDDVYSSYKFPFSSSTFLHKLKIVLIRGFIMFNNSEKGLKRIRRTIAKLERSTASYAENIKTLQQYKPDLIFCTNQRVSSSVAQILAAQDLNIPTVTFIFSWDNLPKGTKIIETDYYFVWSEHMKKELQYYYPQSQENQIFVTGTTQFECHFDTSLQITKALFFEQNNLDINRKYICFSGDDITTSPNDQHYLNDLVKAVKKLNISGFNLGILFRRCPVDFSDRFDEVLEKNRDLIAVIDPKWTKIGNVWNAIMPTKDDQQLLVNTIFHSELVINLASSMVFDFVAYKKPCAYINYNVENSAFPKWSAFVIYNLIHFRSMPTKDAVVWLNSPDEIQAKLEKMLTSSNENTVANAQKWFEKINQHPPEKASERIWDAIAEIINK